MATVVYVAIVVVAVFVISGVVPRYRTTVARRRRAEAFEAKYSAYVEEREREYQSAHGCYGSELPHGQRAAELRAWLVASRNDMQRDAQAVGKGITYVAPPPMIGGPFRPHSYFADLFDEQSFTGHGTQFRQDELATTCHELRRQEALRKRAIFNPWAWTRLAFERIVRCPRYVLTLAGFDTKVTDSTGVRVVTALWSFVVGAATIASLIVAVAQ